MNIPASHDEPGKRRADWSGHDGTHVTVVEVLAEARTALEQGDIKGALSSVDDAIRFYGRMGRGLGMPLEAPAMKSLADCQFQLQAMLTDVKFAGAATEYHATMASKYLSDAELFTS